MICHICTKESQELGFIKYRELDLCDSCMVKVKQEEKNPRMGDPNSQ